MQLSVKDLTQEQCDPYLTKQLKELHRWFHDAMLSHRTPHRPLVVDSGTPHPFISKLHELGITVEGIHHGSIILVLKCPSSDALDKLWKLYEDKTLKLLLEEEPVTKV